ncbi:hypothetical protein ACHAXR_000846, partial [Thalassiosira sp. AJA248-18]
MAPFKKKSEPNNSADEKAAPSSSTTDGADDFSARRSSRVAAGRYTADNDTWVEALAVCEIPVKPGYGDKPANNGGSSKKSGGGGLFRKFKSKNNNINDNEDANANNDGNPSSPVGDAELAAASQRLTLRPYFQSQNTNTRVWDEPPSGASNIVYATAEARKMGQAQLEEMRATYAHAAVHRRQEREEKKARKAAAAALEQSKNGGSTKKLVPKVFRQTSNASTADASQSSTTSLLGNSHSSSRRVKGSLVLADEGGRKGIPKSILEESKELAGVNKDNSKRAYEADLQKAMLMSMGIGGGSVMGVGDNKHRRS